MFSLQEFCREIHRSEYNVSDKIHDVVVGLKRYSFHPSYPPLSPQCRHCTTRLPVSPIPAERKGTRSTYIMLCTRKLPKHTHTHTEKRIIVKVRVHSYTYVYTWKMRSIAMSALICILSTYPVNTIQYYNTQVRKP